MLNPYVTRRLVAWAEWQLKREEGSLGFPKQSPYTRLSASGGTSGYIPDLDSEAMEVDKILLKIKNSDPKIYRVLHMFYGIDFINGKARPTLSNTAQILAKEFGCHRDTLYSWLDKGHRLVLDGFHENDVLAHTRK